ncbi:sigma-70 family RNA polymerase sigma factor [Sphingomonas suaedae]|uniref:Sigma-70 family RNA polymerase sigma factor n=1 Tax=Sphingomonas suaedae TaxID=2599297 RepID=A0A518RHI6_9SPHN|nr:sigma-70 family RNA polymerase sigma factor [Sphingomonas suaedae]QDX26906.1 sigma-70 family RNA polymerase sigma factor [Sphingomonas suaedae]
MKLVASDGADARSALSSASAYRGSPTVRPNPEPVADAARIELIAALTTRFRAPMLQYFRRRLRLAEDAEELTQDLFVRLLRRRNLDDIDNIEVFLYVSAANLLKDYYRALSRRGQAQSIDDIELPSPDKDPSQQAMHQGEIDTLLDAVQALPPKCKIAFVMHRFDEVPHREIARRMGITVSMVEKHIATAMQHLRKRLNDSAQ